MYFVIVTELGVVVSENNSVVKAFAFGNPAADFMDIKKGNLKNNSIMDYLQEIGRAHV